MNKVGVNTPPCAPEPTEDAVASHLQTMMPINPNQTIRPLRISTITE